jgi:hypothetical protein
MAGVLAGTRFGLHAVAVLVGLVGLGLELIQEGDDGVVLALDQSCTVLPDTVLCPPLAPGLITLVLVDVVNPETVGEGLTEDIQRFGVFKQGLEVGKRISARSLLPGRVDCGLREPAQRFEDSIG